MIEDDPEKMSHALALHNAELPQEDMKELVEQIRQGMSVVALKSEIENAVAERKLLSETSKAPDRETAARAAEYSRTGGGNVSRGKQVKGNTSAEAPAGFRGRSRQANL